MEKPIWVGFWSEIRGLMNEDRFEHEIKCTFSRYSNFLVLDSSDGDNTISLNILEHHFAKIELTRTKHVKCT